MRKITKEDKKAYNKYVEKYNQETASANAGAPFLIIGFGIGAYYTQDIVNGYIAIFFIAMAGLVALGMAMRGIGSDNHLKH